MAKTSINFQPIQPSSSVHNERRKELRYVRRDLTPYNQTWKITHASLKSIEKAFKEDYQNTHKKKIPKTTVLLREGVVVLEKETTLDQLKNACRRLERTFGIRTYEIHIHEDEGHRAQDVWIPNRHAHIVSSWYDTVHHTTYKLRKKDLSEIQSIFAEELCMDRGISSDRNHLTALQYKTHQLELEIAQQQARLKAMEEEVAELEKQKRRVKIETENRKKDALYIQALSFIDENIRRGKPRQLIEGLKDIRNVLTETEVFHEEINDKERTIQRLKRDIESIKHKNDELVRLNPNLANMDDLAREMKYAGLEDEQIQHLFVYRQITATVVYSGTKIPDTKVELLPIKGTNTLHVWFNRKTWSEFTKDYRSWSYSRGRMIR